MEYSLFDLEVKSPTRVDLAGGTLDCWPLYLFLGDRSSGAIAADGPVTINVAIDIFTYAHLKERPDSKIELYTADLKTKKTYDSLEDALKDEQPAFELVRAHLRYWKPTKGFFLSTRSESPIGGGLGGSSSLCISLLKVFSKWLDRTLGDEEMVRVASHIEAQILLKPTGTQDYFPPIHGGLNFIQYGVPGPKVEVKKIDQDLFRDRFLLVYTGRSHHSGINNWQVIKSWLDGDTKTRAALAKLADVSAQMKAALVENRVTDLPKIFEREYDARTELSEGFSSPEIKRLSEIAKSQGAVAKICGAGGGGCVLIWCPDRQIEKVRAALSKTDFQVLPTKPWEESTGHA